MFASYHETLFTLSILMDYENSQNHENYVETGKSRYLLY